VENVVITLGAQGSYWQSRSGGRHFAAPSVEAVDTTAAGDAFNGALAWCLAGGRSLEDAIPVANMVGSLATTRVGAQSAMPSLADLEFALG
jgi:ribokinase